MLKHLRSSEAFEQKNLLQKGFTLVELLVVIVILGILAAVVVFAVGGSTSDAHDSACKTEYSTIKSAIAAYQAKNNAYPTMAQLTDGTTGYLQSTPKEYSLGGTPPDGSLVVTTQGTKDGCQASY